MVWVISFSVQTSFIHYFLLITQTKSRTETALMFKAPNPNLFHKLFPPLHAEELKETSPCTFFCFSVTLSRRQSKSRARTSRAPGECVRLSVLSSNSPNIRSSTCVAVVALTPLLKDSAVTDSWQPLFPPTAPSHPSRAAGVMEGLCIPLAQPSQTPFSRTDEGEKKISWGDIKQMNFSSINHFRETIDSRTFECIDPFIKISSSLGTLYTFLPFPCHNHYTSFSFPFSCCCFSLLFFCFDPVILS